MQNVEFTGRGENRHGNRIMELETVANKGNFFVARARGMWWWESEPGCPERGFCSGNLLMEPVGEG